MLLDSIHVRPAHTMECSTFTFVTASCVSSRSSTLDVHTPLCTSSTWSSRRLMMGTMTRSEWSSWWSLSVDWLSWLTMTFRPWRSEILHKHLLIYLPQSFIFLKAHYICTHTHIYLHTLFTSLYIFNFAQEAMSCLFSISWLLWLLAEEREDLRKTPLNFGTSLKVLLSTIIRSQLSCFEASLHHFHSGSKKEGLVMG